MPAPGRIIANQKFSFLRTFALAISAIVLLFVVDRFLAGIQTSDGCAESERLARSGEALLKRGLAEQASEKFRAAYSVDRENRHYQLEMGRAQTAAGRYPDAEATLTDLLQKDATDGAANLTMGRVLVKEGRTTEAFSYFHRAIYGQWKQDARGNRVRIRFELADLLVSQKATDGLLAELLPLEEEAPDDTETKMKLARLFVEAGSAPRAAAVFRDVLRTELQNPDAYEGLGEAEFSRGNYRIALAEFLAVLRFRPDDANTRKRVQICNQILELDPTARGLSSDEQYRRSLVLLNLAMTAIRECAGGSAALELTEAATKAEKLKATPSHRAAGAESNLELAGKLWQARKAACAGFATPTDEYLAPLLNKLVQ